MMPHPVYTAVDLRHEELLRQAEQDRLAGRFREPHAWRRRLGDVLIKLGGVLAEKPRPRVA